MRSAPAEIAKEWMSRQFAANSLHGVVYGLFRTADGLGYSPIRLALKVVEKYFGLKNGQTPRKRGIELFLALSGQNLFLRCAPEYRLLRRRAETGFFGEDDVFQ